jgi:hypothetical protein
MPGVDGNGPKRFSVWAIGGYCGWSSTDAAADLRAQGLR